MVRTTLAIGRGVDDTRSIRDMGASIKRKENQSSSNSGWKRKTSISQGFQGRAAAIRVKAESGLLMTCYHCHQPEHMRRDCP